MPAPVRRDMERVGGRVVLDHTQDIPWNLRAFWCLNGNDDTAVLETHDVVIDFIFIEVNRVDVVVTFWKNGVLRRIHNGDMTDFIRLTLQDEVQKDGTNQEYTDEGQDASHDDAMPDEGVSPFCPLLEFVGFLFQMVAD